MSAGFLTKELLEDWWEERDMYWEVGG